MTNQQIQDALLSKDPIDKVLDGIAYHLSNHKLTTKRALQLAYEIGRQRMAKGIKSDGQ